MERVDTGDRLTWSEFEDVYLQATLWRENKPVNFYTGVFEIEFRKVGSVRPTFGIPGVAEPSPGHQLSVRRDGVKLIVEETLFVEADSYHQTSL